MPLCFVDARPDNPAFLCFGAPTMHLKKVLLPVLILAIGIGGFMALKASRPEQVVAPPQEPVWRVEAITIELHAASPVLTLNGRVESPDLTRAAASAVGRVLSVPVREGQQVSAGQVLLELDPRDFLPRVEQARGEVMEIEAAMRGEHLRHQADLDQLREERRLLDYASAEVARFEQLRRENFFSQAAVDQGRASLARQQIVVRTRELAIADHQTRLLQLQARQVKARANLDQAELAWQRSRVISPYAGYVATIEVSPGDQVATGQTLLSLYPLAGLEVRAKLPATQQDEFLDALRRGEQPSARANLAGEPLQFRLTRVAGAADARGLDAFFTLIGSSANLRVGELLTLEVARSPVRDAATVPYVALYGGRVVYRIEQDRLRAVAVETLGEAGGQPPRLLVRGAELKPGDRVLVTHLPNAANGLKVEILP